MIPPQYDRTRRLWLYFALTALLSGVSCFPVYKSQPEPKATNGVLDLSDWDFQGSGPIALDGFWLLRHNNPLISKPKAPLLVPGNWNKHPGMKANDSAVYELQIQLGELNQNLSVKVLEVRSSYRLKVNGLLRAQNGVPGADARESLHQNRPLVSRPFKPDESGKVLLEVETANFGYIDGGITRSILLGTEEQIHDLRERKLIQEYFFSGCVFIIGVYHLGLFLLGRRDLSILYFSLFCILIVFRTSLVGERYLIHVFPNMNWELNMKLAFLSFFLLPPLFASYVHSTFPNEFSLNILRAIQLVGLLAFLLVIATPVRIYAHLTQTYMVFTILFCLYVSYASLQTLKNQRVGGRLFMISWFVFFAAILNDIFYRESLVNTGYLLNIGLLPYIFIQSMLLSQRYAQTFKSTEKLAQELTRSNKHLRHEMRERRRLEKLSNHHEFHDHLTGLANRALLIERLHGSISAARRRREHLAVFFVNLDRFKSVNDSLGHASGDWLLNKAAERLQENIRDVDILARQGGDEFIIILSRIPGREDALFVADKIIKAMQARFMYEKNELYTTISVGIALYPQNGAGAEELVKNANAAMSQIKLRGGNGYEFYSSTFLSGARDKLLLESQLRKATASRQFDLVYQPRVEVDTGRICGLEALIRWEHPERGPISPAEFIPIAEETGLIDKIGEWVLRKACEQNKLFQNAGFTNLVIAVNISPRQFRNPELMNQIRTILKDTGLPPELLEIEITEGTVMEEPENARDILEALSNAGIKVALDDFGTGYSSLAYLQSFPLNVLKIDRTFITGLRENTDYVSIVEAIITLGQSLKLKVVAEGVEHKEEFDFLKALNCNEIQGNYFSHPISADEIAYFFANWPFIPEDY